MKNIVQGKTVVLSGANSGIGKATAMALAAKGARLILICRTEQKGFEVRQEILDSTQSNAVIEVLACDFSSLAQIRRVADEVALLTPTVDVLLNNAGAIFKSRELTVDGYEMSFGVNHLGYFLLTNLLLPQLQNADNARIVNVASDAHRFVRQFDFDNLQGEKSFSQWQAYGLSKLCNILFTYELARRLSNTKITANCLHPGVVSTNFGKDAGWLLNTFSKISQFFILSPEKGAETSIYLASSPEVAGVSGAYFVKCKPVKSSALSYDQPTAQRLWTVSEELTQIGSSAI